MAYLWSKAPPSARPKDDGTRLILDLCPLPLWIIGRCSCGDDKAPRPTLDGSQRYDFNPIPCCLSRPSQSHALIIEDRFHMWNSQHKDFTKPSQRLRACTRCAARNGSSSAGFDDCVGLRTPTVHSFIRVFTPVTTESNRSCAPTRDQVLVGSCCSFWRLPETSPSRLAATL